MKPPIVLNESRELRRSGDVTFFSSVEDAAAYMEPVDVENNEYFAFDSTGLRLALKVAGDSVFIQPGESSPTHQGVLRGVLVDFYKRIGIYGPWCETADLNELVERGARTRR